MRASHRFLRKISALALGAAVLTTAVSCDRNPSSTLLSLDAGDGEEEESFISGYSMMQVVGGFNNWDETIASMSLVADGVWADTLVVSAGCFLMKFRTEGDWDETSDFGRCDGDEGECQTEVPATEGEEVRETTCLREGTGTAIGELQFTETGPYEFTIDDEEGVFTIRRVSNVGAIAGTVRFSDDPAPPLPEVTVEVREAGTENVVASGEGDEEGGFLVENVVPGVYDVVVDAFGYLPVKIENVEVIAFETTDVGEVTLEPAGTISGSVSFDDDPPESPPVTIQAFEIGTTDLIASTISNPADNTYLMRDLATGVYDLSFQASGYEEEIVTDVSVTAPDDTPLPPVALEFGCTSTFTAIQLVGEFNNWNTGTPSMVSTSPCVWADTLSLSPGCFFMKFRTDNDWGTPNFERCTGSEEVCQTPVPSDGSSITESICLGSSAGNAIGQLEFTAAGQYEFLLDEGAGSFEVRLLGEGTTAGALSGNVGFSDNPPLPHPTVTVSVLEVGTTNVIATVSSDETDRFLVPNLEAGDYDVSFAATSYVTLVLGSVAVVAADTTTLGTVILEKIGIGSISGRVTYSDAPQSQPSALVTVFRAGTTDSVTAASTNVVTGLFSIPGVLEGSYDLRFQAPGYLDATVFGVTVVGETDTDVGDVTLDPGCVSGFTQMQVVGDFNGFDPGAPLMSRISSCVWADTLNIPSGCHLIKFRTDGDDDATPDFGRCSGSEEPCQVRVPLTGDFLTEPVCQRTGPGVALGEVEFLIPGNYEFTLDEAASEYSIRRVQ